MVQKRSIGKLVAVGFIILFVIATAGWFIFQTQLDKYESMSWNKTGVRSIIVVQ